MICIGIDPGVNGGMAAIKFSKGGEIQKVNITTMPHEYQDYISWLVKLHDDVPTTAVIEKNSGFIGTRVGNKKGFGNPGSRMFTFGQNYGAVQMLLQCFDIPMTLVTPNVWQRAMGIQPKSKLESKGNYKNRLKNEAEYLLPRNKITLATADAVLLAFYCKQISRY